MHNERCIFAAGARWSRSAHPLAVGTCVRCLSAIDIAVGNTAPAPLIPLAGARRSHTYRYSRCLFVYVTGRLLSTVTVIDRNGTSFVIVVHKDDVKRCPVD